MGDDLKIDKIQFANVLRTSRVSEDQIELLWNNYQTTGKLPEHFLSLLNVSNKPQESKDASKTPAPVNTVFNDAPIQGNLSLGLSVQKSKPQTTATSETLNKHESTTPQNITMTDAQAKDFTITSLGTAVKSSRDSFLAAAENEGIVSKGYNSAKEFINDEMSKSSVTRELYTEQTGVVLMDRANKGDLTKKEYYDAKIKLLMDMIPDSKTMSAKDKAILENNFRTFAPEKLNGFITTVATCSPEDYQALARRNQALIKQDKPAQFLKDSSRNQLTFNSKAHKAYQISGAQEKITFEEVFLAERENVYKKENVEQFKNQEALFSYANEVQTKSEAIHSLLDSDVALVKGNNQGAVDKMTEKNSNTRLAISLANAMKERYGEDSKKIDAKLKELSANNLVSYENGRVQIGGLAKSMESYSLVTIAEKLLKETDANCKKALGGKKFEDCQKDYANSYVSAYGDKNPKELAKAYSNDQEGFVQKVKMGVQVGGMVIAFVAPEAYALVGMGLSTFGGTAVGALNEGFRKNGMSPEAKAEIKKELVTNMEFLAVGLGAGTLGTSAKAALVAKNCPKMVAFAGEYGTNALGALAGDLAINGELDLKQESIGQAMILVSSIIAHKKMSNRIKTKPETETVATETPTQPAPKILEGGIRESDLVEEVPFARIEQPQIGEIPIIKTTKIEEAGLIYKKSNNPFVKTKVSLSETPPVHQIQDDLSTFHNQRTPHPNDLTEELTRDLYDSKDLEKLLIENPTLNRTVGKTPKALVKLLKTPNEQEGFTSLDKTFRQFSQTTDTELLEKQLNNLIDGRVQIEALEGGSIGSAYKITINEQSYVLKIFNKDNEKYGYYSKHGKGAEVPAGVFASKFADKEEFAEFYMGRVAKSTDTDAYMLTTFVEKPEVQDRSYTSIQDKIRKMDSNDAIFNTHGKTIIDYGSSKINKRFVNSEVKRIAEDMAKALDNNSIEQLQEVIAKHEKSPHYEQAKLAIQDLIQDKENYLMSTNPKYKPESDIYTILGIEEKKDYRDVANNALGLNNNVGSRYSLTKKQSAELILQANSSYKNDLSVYDYKNLKRLGFSDKELREKYNIDTKLIKEHISESRSDKLKEIISNITKPKDIEDITTQRQLKNAIKDLKDKNGKPIIEKQYLNQIEFNNPLEMKKLKVLTSAKDEKGLCLFSNSEIKDLMEMVKTDSPQKIDALEILTKAKDTNGNLLYESYEIRSLLARLDIKEPYQVEAFRTAVNAKNSSGKQTFDIRTVENATKAVQSEEQLKLFQNIVSHDETRDFKNEEISNLVKRLNTSDFEKFSIYFDGIKRNKSRLIQSESIINELNQLAPLNNINRSAFRDLMAVKGEGHSEHLTLDCIKAIYNNIEAPKDVNNLKMLLEQYRKTPVPEYDLVQYSNKIDFTKFENIEKFDFMVSAKNEYSERPTFHRNQIIDLINKNTSMEELHKLASLNDSSAPEILSRPLSEAEKNEFGEFVKNTAKDNHYNAIMRSVETTRDAKIAKILLNSDIKWNYGEDMASLIGEMKSQPNEMIPLLEKLVKVKKKDGENAFYTNTIRKTLQSANGKMLEDMKQNGVWDAVLEGDLPARYLLNSEISKYSEQFIKDFKMVRNNETFVKEYPRTMNHNEILKTTDLADVVSIDNVAYINEGKSLTKLNMTAKMYEKLFPPVKRHDTYQGQIGDCYLVSVLAKSMENPRAKIELYKLFRQEGNDIYVNLPKYKEQFGEVKFTNGEITLPEKNGYSFIRSENVGKNLEGAPGLQMLEQTYARQANRSKGIGLDEAINTKNIEELMSRIDDGGSQLDVIDALFFNKYTSKSYNGREYYHSQSEIKNVLTKGIDDPNKLFFFSTRQDCAEGCNPDYNIQQHHAQYISGYDPKTEIVKVSNPNRTFFNAETPLSVWVKHNDAVHEIEFKTPKIEAPKTEVPVKTGAEVLADKLNIAPDKRVNIANFSKEIFENTTAHFEEMKANFDNRFKHIKGVETQSRAKTLYGMVEKTYRLLERVTDKKQKLLDKLDKATSEEQKEQINNAIAEQDKLFEAMTVEYSILLAQLTDSLGERVILNNPTTENIDQVVDGIIAGIESGEFRVLDLENYGADENHIYFNQEQIDRIKTACEKDNKKRGLQDELIPQNKYKPSGYTTTQLDLVYKNGVRCELQIRDAKVNEWSEAEHILYDFAEGKDVAKGNKEIEELLNPIYDAIKIKNANKNLSDDYIVYGKDCYRDAWDKATGTPAEPLVLPEGIPKALDKENIIRVHEKLLEIQNRNK